MITATIGTMKSEKTFKLIKTTEFLNKLNKKYIVFHPACCAKDEEGVITRRGLQKAKAVKVFEIQDMYNYLKDIDVCLIDEFTFLCGGNNIDDFMEFLEYCDVNGIDVNLFGICLDYMSNSLDIAQRVLPYCDYIDTVSAKCEECGDIAKRCVRYINGELDNDPNSSLLIMEDKNVVYKSVCKECYRKLTGLPAIK